MRLVSFLAEAWSVRAPDEALTWVVHGSAAVALTALSVALMNPGFLVRFRRLILELSRLASTVILGVVGLQVHSFTGLEFEPDISHGVIVPLAASVSVWSAAMAGSQRLRNRRRERPTKDYIPIHKAVDEEAEYELQDWFDEQRRRRAQQSRKQARQKQQATR